MSEQAGKLSGGTQVFDPRFHQIFRAICPLWSGHTGLNYNAPLPCFGKIHGKLFDFKVNGRYFYKRYPHTWVYITQLSPGAVKMSLGMCTYNIQRRGLYRKRCSITKTYPHGMHDVVSIKSKLHILSHGKLSRNILQGLWTKQQIKHQSPDLSSCKVAISKQPLRCVRGAPHRRSPHFSTIATSLWPGTLWDTTV